MGSDHGCGRYVLMYCSFAAFQLLGIQRRPCYTLSFLLLSPVVAFSAINGGETAILKGAGMLRQLAKSQLINVIAALCISIPLYWRFRLLGLVPSLVLVSFASMLVTCRYSFKAFPYRVKPFSGKTLAKGFSMIRLGIFLPLQHSSVRVPCP